MSPFWRPKLLTIQLTPDKLFKKVEVEILKMSKKLSNEQLEDLLGYSVPSIIAGQLGYLLDVYGISLCGYLLIFLDKGRIYVKADRMNGTLDEGELETNVLQTRIDLIKAKHGVYSSMFYPEFRDAFSASLYDRGPDVRDLLLAYTGQISRMLNVDICEKMKSALLIVVESYLDALKDPHSNRTIMRIVNTHYLYKIWSDMPLPQDKFSSLLQKLMRAFKEEYSEDWRYSSFLWSFF